MYATFTHRSWTLNLLSNASPDGHKPAPALWRWRPWQLRRQGVTPISRLAQEGCPNNALSRPTTQCAALLKPPLSMLHCFSVCISAAIVGSSKTHPLSPIFFIFPGLAVPLISIVLIRSDKPRGPSERFRSLAGSCCYKTYSHSCRRYGEIGVAGGGAFGHTH